MNRDILKIKTFNLNFEDLFQSPLINHCLRLYIILLPLLPLYFSSFFNVFFFIKILAKVKISFSSHLGSTLSFNLVIDHFIIKENNSKFWGTKKMHTHKNYLKKYIIFWSNILKQIRASAWLVRNLFNQIWR